MERLCCVNVSIVQTVPHPWHHMNTSQTEHGNALKVERVHMEISVYINLLTMNNAHTCTHCWDRSWGFSLHDHLLLTVRCEIIKLYLELPPVFRNSKTVESAPYWRYCIHSFSHISPCLISYTAALALPEQPVSSTDISPTPSASPRKESGKGLLQKS